MKRRVASSSSRVERCTPPPDLLLGERGEPAFDQVEPGSRSGREVQVEAGALDQPASDEQSFARAVVVEDEMDIEIGWDRAVEGIQELAEFPGAMPPVQWAEHRARLGIEGGEQAGGAMPLVVMRAAFGLARTHRQQGRSTIQGLNLALLVHAKDQRAVRWMEIKSHDIAHLVDQQRIATQLEGLGAMRGQREGAPDAADAALAQATGFGQRARGPMRGVFRQRDLREMKVTPHAAQNNTNRRSAIDGRTTQHLGYAISQKKRKRIEESFGWMKTIGMLKKVKLQGLEKVSWLFTFVAAVYNLYRLQRLEAQAI
jgi:hypothetical protein